MSTSLLHALPSASPNVQRQACAIDRLARARLKGHRPAVVWLTGLSGAGKSTIANALDRLLHQAGHHTVLLDGDNLRHGLNRDLGFTAADRIENVRRVAEVGRLMADAGLIAIVACISPFRAERDHARSLLAEGEFIEVHVDVPLDVVEGRDVKGLYRRARAGELRNFTGIDSPYEVPEHPELRVPGHGITAEEGARRVLDKLACLGIVGPTGRNHPWAALG